MSILPKQSRARLAFVALGIFAAASSATAQNELIRVETELVNLNVVVTDRQGRRLSGLRREDFEVYEDGAQQEITHFTATERSLRLVLVFDVSLSMEAVLPMVKREARALLGSLRPGDEVSVISFASAVRRHSGWLNSEQAAEVINSVMPEAHAQPAPATSGRIGDANTYLYEAFQYVFNNFPAANDKIAVILFSDGVDTAAGRAAPNVKKRAEELGSQVLEQAQESWALIYPVRYQTEQAIGTLPKPSWRPFPNVIRIGAPPADPGRELFTQIAAATGGAVFEWTTRQDLIAASEKALADLRSQYSLAYAPPHPQNRNNFRRLQVRLKQPNLVARTRRGYFYDRLGRRGAASPAPPNHRLRPVPH